jgi:hypothetical protein
MIKLLNNSYYKKITNRFLIVFVFLLWAMMPVDSMADGNQSLPSYDYQEITPTTWQQVSLTYHDQINGKNYQNKIQLLRPLQWLHDHGMDKVGHKIELSINEFGIDHVKATVTDIQPTTVDSTKLPLTNSSIVIGKFTRYAKVVNTYTFKDSQGNIQTVNATPNHPFYVTDKKAYVAIDKVSSTDNLIDDKGQTVKLICPTNKTTHCGRLYNTDGQPTIVYNLEVYRRHHYFVGDTGIFGA